MAKEKDRTILDMIEAELGELYEKLDELTMREGRLLGAKEALQNGHALPPTVSAKAKKPTRKQKPTRKHKMVMKRGGWAKLVQENPGTLTIDGLAKLAGAPRDSASQALRGLWRHNKIERVRRGVYRTVLGAP